MGFDLVTCLLERFPNPDHVPLYVARDGGFFREAGLDVSLLVPADPDDPMRLAAGRKVDFVLNHQPGVLLARAGGARVVSIGLLIEHMRGTSMTLESSGIESLADLEGKRIGCAVAAFDQAMFELVADHVGIPKGQYEFVDAGFALTAALLEGRVDAVMGAFKNYEVIEAELQGRAVRAFELEKYGVPDFCHLVFIASEETVRSRAPLCRRFIQAMARAIEFTPGSPGEATEIYFAANPACRGALHTHAFQATFPYYARRQRQAPGRWADVAAAMAARGLLPTSTPDLGAFTSAFVPEEGR